MKPNRILLILVLALTVVSAAVGCGAEPVEVTRVVEVPGESAVIEVTRVVVEEVEVEAGPKYPEGTQLQILQWSHFVPRYDDLV
jgi:Flp pilus assembly protein CpaB